MKNKSVLFFLALIFLVSCKSDSEEKIYTVKQPRNGYFKGIIDITLSEGLFVDGKPHGCWFEYFGDEEVRRVINYKNGVKHGMFIEIDRQGYIIAQRNYKNGQLDGLALEYVHGKRIYHTNYKDGVLHGEKKSFYEDSGRMRDAFIYVDGKKNGSATYYYVNGKRMARYKYKNDLMHGEQLMFRETGKKLSMETYNMAVKEGPAEEYNEKGLLLHSGDYQNEEKVGMWYTYDELGNVIDSTKHADPVQK